MRILLFDITVADLCLCFWNQQILDEKKNPHLCSFAITKINAGEEVVYDYGDPSCHWRHVFIFTFILLYFVTYQRLYNHHLLMSGGDFAYTYTVLLF